MITHQFKQTYPSFYSMFFSHLLGKGLKENDIESLSHNFYYDFFRMLGWTIDVTWYRSGCYVAEINGMVHYFYVTNKPEAEELAFLETVKQIEHGNGNY